MSIAYKLRILLVRTGLTTEQADEFVDDLSNPTLGIAEFSSKWCNYLQATEPFLPKAEWRSHTLLQHGSAKPLNRIHVRD